MLLRGLIVFLWFIGILLALVATFQFALGTPDGNLIAVVFWWGAVLGSFYYDHKHKAGVE